MKKAKKATNKTAFILAQGDVSAAEVIQRGKKAGIKLTDRYVYSARSKAKMQKAKGITPGRRGRPPKNKKAVQTNGSSAPLAAEQQFTSLVLELGLSRSEALLKDIRNRPFF